MDRSKEIQKGSLGVSMALSAFLIPSLASLSLLFWRFQGLPQVAFSVALLAAYIAISKVRDPSGSYLDAGSIFVACVTLYQIFPLATLEISNYNFGVFADGRLGSIALSQEFLSDIWLAQTFIVIGFASTYLIIRNRIEVSKVIFDQSQITSLAIWLILAIVGRFMYTQFVIDGGAYLDEYMARQGGSRFTAQILNILDQIVFIGAFGLFISFMKKKIQLVIAVYILGVIALLLITSARSPVVVISLGLLICYDRYRLQVKVAPLALFGILSVGIFLFAGVLRAGGYLEDIFGQNEFLALYVTTLDVYQIALTGRAGDIGASLWLSDLLRPIPGQLLPFEKLDLANWYVSTFYPAHASEGAGYGFGMASEAMLTGGWWSGLIRGGLLGIVMGVALSFLEKKNSIYAHITIVWMISLVYLAYRSATFGLLSLFLTQFAPAIIIVAFTSRFILKSRI